METGISTVDTVLSFPNPGNHQLQKNESKQNWMVKCQALDMAVSFHNKSTSFYMLWVLIYLFTYLLITLFILYAVIVY